MIEINADFNTADLSAIASHLREFHRTSFVKAVNRASVKLARYLNTHIARQAGMHLGIQPTKFKQYRIKLKLGSREGVKEVWIGTAPIAAHHLKNPRWRRQWKGARAGGNEFAGTFMANSKTKGGDANGMKVFKRLPGIYTNTGKEALSVEKMAIDETMKEVVSRLTQQANARYRVLLLQELNFELSKL